jgi:hypothetical protein
MTQFEDIQKLAAQLGVGVEQLPGRSDWCQLAMPSRISPSRRMPPLMLTTAKELLNEELKKEDSARVPIAAE